MLSAATAGNHEAFSMAASQIEAAAEEGHAGALSVLAFLSGAGMTRPASRSRALLLHKLAADAGDLQSKMALAYSYFRQEMYEQAATLYAESAKATLSSLISKMPPIKIIERFKIYSGTEENKEALMKSRGEYDDDFQITEYQAQRGNASAIKQRFTSFLLLQAREFFELAAANKEFGGHYYLGLLYLKGIGVKKDVIRACYFFLDAVNSGQTNAIYQVAKLFQKGICVKRNPHMAVTLYKVVAERGPWRSLSRWALESYLKGDLGKALLLYSRMAELGYEVAQSNAAWTLDRYNEQSICIGESGFCTNAERHLRAHAFWWQASEQGNEHASFLISDPYYYGGGEHYSPHASKNTYAW
ncbi:hypothetical protein PR202_gb19291 [Eleusine coracana subsp. coracana]|uniref:Uncharacterized protein n=1 Tax=Eleusine coracana subsp. coracana TaxID=191504 RepID=A0AAV5F5L1_ELECO|nr:hypothetical protein PR202_gb19291 [Eleusine coracana subsp. coracana]